MKVFNEGLCTTIEQKVFCNISGNCSYLPVTVSPVIQWQTLADRQARTRGRMPAINRELDVAYCVDRLAVANEVHVE